jgi:hypothetical protein
MVLHLVNCFLNCCMSHHSYNRFQTRYLVATGVFDALNGVAIVFPSLPAHLVPVLSNAWLAMGTPMMVAIRRLITKERVSNRALGAIAVATIGCLFCFLPMTIQGLMNSDAVDADNTVYWSLIMLAGLLFANLMTLATEYALKGSHLDATRRHQSSRWEQYYLIVKFEMYRSWIQTATMLLLNFLDVLPWFGTSTSLGEVWQHVYQGMRCMAQTADSPAVCSTVWPLLFGFASAYVVAYLTSDILTWHFDANVSTFVQGVSVPIGIMFFVVTPDAKGLSPSFIFAWASVGAFFILVGSIWLAVEQRRKEQAAPTTAATSEFAINNDSAPWASGVDLERQRLL